MYDKILRLAQQGKITSFEPLDAGGTSWTRQQLEDVVEGISGTEPFDIAEVDDFLYAKATEYHDEHGTPMMPLDDTFKGAMMRLPFPLCWFEFATHPTVIPDAPPRMAIVATEDESSASGLDFSLTPLTLHTTDGGVTFSLIGGDANILVVLDEDGLYQRTIASNQVEEAFKPHQKLLLSHWMSRAMYAIHLLHWRDVQTITVSPSRQQVRQAQRTGNHPPVEYKKVKIARWVKKYNSVTQDGGGWEQRWHKVIGHSKTWTESAPQFGCLKCGRGGPGHPPYGRKSHIGTFWIDAHYAGDEDLGEIRHVYTVEPPAGGQQNPPSSGAQQNPPTPGGQQNRPSGQKSFSATAGEDSK